GFDLQQLERLGPNLPVSLERVQAPVPIEGEIARMGTVSMTVHAILLEEREQTLLVTRGPSHGVALRGAGPVRIGRCSRFAGRRGRESARKPRLQESRYSEQDRSRPNGGRD